MFTIANILTGCNLLFGILSIIFTFSGRLELAVLAILCGALCDFFDGFAARILHQDSEMGKQLDSLADLVTFGVAPGMIAFVLLILSGGWNIIMEKGGGFQDFWMEGTMGHNVQVWINIFLNDLVGNQSPHLSLHFSTIQKVVPFFALLLPFFSLFRLAKFNIDKRQTTGFIGLPTPANSIFFASFALMLWEGFGAHNWKTVLSMMLISYKVLIPCILISSLFLISETRLFSLKFTHFKWRGNKVRYIFLFLSLIIILLLWVWALPIIILLYIVLSIANNRFKKINKNNNYEVQS